MRPLGLAGQRALQARLARLCRSHRSSSDRRTTGVSPHHTMTCTDVGGRVTNGAGFSVAAEWSDRARTVALRPLPRWCGCVYKPGCLWPLQMTKHVSKRATRGGEKQSTETPGHRIRAPRPERSVRSVWTRRTCFCRLWPETLFYNTRARPAPARPIDVSPMLAIAGLKTKMLADDRRGSHPPSAVGGRREQVAPAPAD